MRRLLICCAVALPLVALTAGPAWAEVKTREKTHVSLGGMIGKMFNIFGGKAAKEGVVATTAVKGNRKATMNDSTGQIIDLTEEKIYDLDIKKKTYEVTTFEELRRRMREARERARKTPRGAAGQRRETGENRAAERVRGRLQREGDRAEEAARRLRHARGDHDDHRPREGQDARGRRRIVMTVDSWLGPQIAALKELAEFDLKYWKQLAGPDAMGMSAEQLATVIAMFPAVKQGMDRLQKEGPKLQGTPLATTTTVEGVKSKEQAAQQADGSAEGGGRIGRHARAQDGQEGRHARADAR